MKYEKHLTFTLFLIVLFWLINSVYQFHKTTLLEALVFTFLCLFGGLFLDIDSVSSKPRKLVNEVLLSLVIILMFGLVFFQLKVISLIILCCLMYVLLKTLKHRGKVHTWRFVGLVSIIIILFCNYLKIDYFVVSGWILGSASHLFLDDLQYKWN